ncbi:lysozyme [Flavobacterium sp.]|uniref:lysozyme n=1 Tax=Flavobacterium sp. TaxID=239 RepID=UPI0038FBFF26
MKTSQIGIDLIKHFEGLHDGDLKTIGLQPKKCPAGIWTQGYGSAMRDKNGNFLKGNVMPKVTLTEKEAEVLLAKTLEVFENIVMRKIKILIKQNQFDALVSHAYNTGGSDTLFKLVNQKAPSDQIKKWFETKYITSGGVKLNGLIARRKAESKLFFHE